MKETIYRKVDVNDYLPTESGRYICINPKMKTPFEVWYDHDNETWKIGTMTFFVKDSGITHWLEETTLNLHTDDELKKIREDDMKSAYGCGWGDALIFMDNIDDPDLMVKKFAEFIERHENVRKYLENKTQLNQEQK